MTEKQWDVLLGTINGERYERLPIGFIIDSPWLPGWYGVSTLDYYTSDNIWFKANLKAIETFPDVMFLPGLWSEYGMCTEPSAFGCKSVWSEQGLPYAEKVIHNFDQAKELVKPDVKKEGLLPFVLKHLLHNEDTINKQGHFIKFAISRGPLNIASFLVGTTEFLMGIKTNPDEAHKLLSVITDFIIDWLTLQLETFPSIDGVFLLDDIVGFLGEGDFKDFVLPYMKKIYQNFDVKVKFFHNDAEGIVCAPYLKEIGINLFNFTFKHGLDEMKRLTDNSVVLLGNIPPRDVLANGTKEDIRSSVKEALNSVEDKTRIIMSCGGGMPQDVSTENIKVFIDAVRENS